MTDTTRRALVTGLLLVGLAVTARAHAQAPVPTSAASQERTPAEPEADITSEIARARGAIQPRRQPLVTMAMDLEPGRVLQVISTYRQGSPNLSERAAAKLLDDYLVMEKARTGAQASFVPPVRHEWTKTACGYLVRSR